jgi:hypothetical protein
MIPETTVQLARDLIALQVRAKAEQIALTAASEASEGVVSIGQAALAEEMEQVGKVLTNYIPRLMKHIGEIDPPTEETPVQVGQLEEPVDIAIPQFLAPETVTAIPEGLAELAEPGETAAEMQARLWSLWLELNGKLMLGLASQEEIALHTRLHNELHWFAPPVDDVADDAV